MREIYTRIPCPYDCKDGIQYCKCSVGCDGSQPCPCKGEKFMYQWTSIELLLENISFGLKTGDRDDYDYDEE